MDFTHFFVVRVLVSDLDGFSTIEEVRYTHPFNGENIFMEDRGNGFYSDSLDFGVGDVADSILSSSLGCPVEVTVTDNMGKVVYSDEHLSVNIN